MEPRWAALVNFMVAHVSSNSLVIDMSSELGSSKNVEMIMILNKCLGLICRSGLSKSVYFHRCPWVFNDFEVFVKTDPGTTKSKHPYRGLVFLLWVIDAKRMVDQATPAPDNTLPYPPLPYPTPPTTLHYPTLPTLPRVNQGPSLI